MMKKNRSNIKKWKKVIEESGEFDKLFYLKHNAEARRSELDPVMHYLLHGSEEGYWPNDWFDTGFYRSRYPDVEENGYEPFVHYLMSGREEGRACCPEAVVDHEEETVAAGREWSEEEKEWYRIIEESGLFDGEYYLSTYEDARRDGREPLAHYIEIGAYKNYNPNDWFDTAFYLKSYVDVTMSGINPFVHYILYGREEKRICYPLGTSRDKVAGGQLSMEEPKLNGEKEKPYFYEKKAIADIGIRKLDREALMEANPDLDLTEEPVDGVVPLDGALLQELAAGARAFHPDYLPYDEGLYLNIYPDIRRMVRDPACDYQRGFDHFCESGYEEIVSGRREWPKAAAGMEEGGDPRLVALPLKYFWLKMNRSIRDPFFVALFLEHFDQDRYLLANRDVREAVEKGDLESGEEHLIYHGIEDILLGRREMAPGVWLTDELIGSIDFTFEITESALMMMGWMHLKGSRIEKMIVSDGEKGIVVPDASSRFARPDLENMLGAEAAQAGIVTYVEHPALQAAGERELALIVVAENGLVRRFPLEPKPLQDLKEASQKILSSLAVDENLRKNLDRTMGVALKRYSDTHPTRIDEEEIAVHCFGAIPERPEVSLIVPLYGRIDFVEYQLSLFSNDSFFEKKVDLIYVLDDPTKHGELLRLAEDLHPLFPVPFRVVTYGENYGYAIANNIGARYARAERLLLLNSDVMPKEKGWLEELLSAYDELEEVGALGPKLLFEDESVQHAGMAFEWSDRFGMWLNEHPGKGLPDLSDEKEPREVPAVTAACLLVDRRLYEEVGGLSENYILGDFEDSDFCLKLIEKGKRNYYHPGVTLYHLERQSQNLFSDQSWKTKVTLYNGWQHTRRWNDLISKLMGETV